MEVAAALAAAGTRRPVRFWLRDDDAVDVTPALRRLAALCEPAGLPVMLAIIPAGLTPALGDWLSDHPGLTPCQHGYAHINHAAPGARACELGGDRDDGAVLADLAAGRARLRHTLGPRLSDMLVPPWNRIRDSLLPALPELGYGALSTFADTKRTDPSPLPRLDCDLDIIDWRNERRGRTIADLCTRLLPLIAQAGETGRPIGVLSHHLAHDEAAWAFLDAFVTAMASSPHAVFTSAAAESLIPPR